MKQAATLFAMVVAGAACLCGVVMATPPTARADTLPNGYSITCTPNGADAICNVSGCPRVHADEAGDVIHVREPGMAQAEISKGCNNASTFNIYHPITGPRTVSIQGCRKHSPGSDDCGSWSDYTYTPPAPAVVNPPAPAVNAPVPNAQKPVLCEGVGLEPPGTDCSKVTPVHCPAGSASSTVPPGQQCAAPTNAVAMNITQSGLNAHAAITNKSNLPASCSYTAKKTRGDIVVLAPQEVDKHIDVGANSTNSITDMLWPPPGTSYHAVVTCTVTYNGKETSVGQASQDVNG
jgi:hypothetical protein